MLGRNASCRCRTEVCEQGDHRQEVTLQSERKCHVRSMHSRSCCTAVNGNDTCTEGCSGCGVPRYQARLIELQQKGGFGMQQIQALATEELLEEYIRNKCAPELASARPAIPS